MTFPKTIQAVSVDQKNLELLEQMDAEVFDLSLARIRDNKEDPNAIAIMAHPVVNGRYARALLIGWVPGQLAAVLAPLIDSYAAYPNVSEMKRYTLDGCAGFTVKLDGYIRNKRRLPPVIYDKTTCEKDNVFMGLAFACSHKSVMRATVIQYDKGIPEEYLIDPEINGVMFRGLLDFVAEKFDNSLMLITNEKYGQLIHIEKGRVSVQPEDDVGRRLRSNIEQTICEACSGTYEPAGVTCAARLEDVRQWSKKMSREGE